MAPQGQSPPSAVNATPASQKGKPPPKGYFPPSPKFTVQNPPTASSNLSNTTIPPSYGIIPAEAEEAQYQASYEAARRAVLDTFGPTNDTISIFNPSSTPRERGGRGSRGGRGGVRIKVEPNDTEGLSSIGHHIETPTSRSRGGRPRGSSSRGGRPRTGRGSRGGRMPGRASGIKRARGQDYSDGEDGNQDASSGEEMIALPTISRSGRRITQASNFSPMVIDLDGEGDSYIRPSSPSAIKSNTFASADMNTATLARGGGISSRGSRRTSTKLPKRKPGEAAVCRNCGRGYSPPSNMIVFCDGCNTPWHQSCHDPPIPSSILRIESSTWFCGDCTFKNSSKSTWERRVGMGNLSLVEQRHYLSTLPAEDLVSLVLQATSIHPDLPIFTPPVDDEGDDGWNYLQERELLPYPRPGNGVRLRPEKEDEGMLIDDNIVAFSHCFGWTERDLFGQEGGGGRGMAGESSMMPENVMLGRMGIGVGVR